MTLTAKRVEIGDEKMRELKLSSPLNIQIITESERMALRIALDKSIGENLGMVLALKDTKREMPQGLYNSGLDYHRDNLEIYLRLRNRLEDAIYEAESNGKQGDKKALFITEIMRLQNALNGGKVCQNVNRTCAFVCLKFRKSLFLSRKHC